MVELESRGFCDGVSQILKKNPVPFISRNVARSALRNYNRALQRKSHMPLATVRRDWLAATLHGCQGIIGLAERVASIGLSRAISQKLERLPTPHTSLERVVLRGALLDVAARFGPKAHAAFHRQRRWNGKMSCRDCPFVAAAALEHWGHGPSAAPVRQFRRWLNRYLREFRAAHPLSGAAGAEDYLRLHFRARLDYAALARRLACSPSHLSRSFKRARGQTLRAYQADLRLKEALRQLRETDLKVEAVAIDVGYRSKKDFYRIVRVRLGCTPGELRRRPRPRQRAV